MSLGPAILDGDIAALLITNLPQSLAEGGAPPPEEVGFKHGGGVTHKPDAGNFRPLLRVRGARFGLEVVPLEIRRAEDIVPAFAELKGQADALYVVSDTLVAANRTRIITLALGAKLPTIYGNREPVQGGGLMSYGPNLPALFWRAAELVDKILRGTKPADIPVEQPTKFDLVVNQTTAKVLGLTIPESFLSLADEVIE